VSRRIIMSQNGVPSCGIGNGEGSLSEFDFGIWKCETCDYCWWRNI